MSDKTEREYTDDEIVAFVKEVRRERRKNPNSEEARKARVFVNRLMEKQRAREEAERSENHTEAKKYECVS